MDLKKLDEAKLCFEQINKINPSFMLSDKNIYREKQNYQSVRDEKTIPIEYMNKHDMRNSQISNSSSSSILTNLEEHLIDNDGNNYSKQKIPFYYKCNVFAIYHIEFYDKNINALYNKLPYSLDDFY